MCTSSFFFFFNCLLIWKKRCWLKEKQLGPLYMNHLLDSCTLQPAPPSPLPPTPAEGPGPACVRQTEISRTWMTRQGSPVGLWSAHKLPFNRLTPHLASVAGWRVPWGWGGHGEGVEGDGVRGGCQCSGDGVSCGPLEEEEERGRLQLRHTTPP